MISSEFRMLYGLLNLVYAFSTISRATKISSNNLASLYSEFKFIGLALFAHASHSIAVESRSQLAVFCCFFSPGVHIEMSLARDQSLSVVITGKNDKVMQARKQVVQQLQTQANTS